MKIAIAPTVSKIVFKICSPYKAPAPEYGELCSAQVPILFPFENGKVAMTSWFLRLGAAIALWGIVPLGALHAAHPVHAEYEVVSVKAALEPSETIGKRKAGLVCLPAGAYRWRDARAGLADAVQTVSTALHDRAPDHVQIPNRLLDGDAPRARYRIGATIIAVAINGCEKNWGVAAKLSRSKKLVGQATIKVRWEIADSVTRATSEPLDTTATYDIASQRGDIEEAVDQGLGLNAVEFAKKQWTSPAAE